MVSSTHNNLRTAIHTSLLTQCKQPIKCCFSSPNKQTDRHILIYIRRWGTVVQIQPWCQGHREAPWRQHGMGAPSTKLQNIKICFVFSQTGLCSSDRRQCSGSPLWDMEATWLIIKGGPDSWVMRSPLLSSPESQKSNSQHTFFPHMMKKWDWWHWLAIYSI
jgi:hypothetical protein